VDEVIAHLESSFRRLMYDARQVMSTTPANKSGDSTALGICKHTVAGRLYICMSRRGINNTTGFEQFVPRASVSTIDRVPTPASQPAIDMVW
jgi:hypothetical protein